MGRIRPQRMPIFVGCEGQSEVDYVGWLRNLARDRHLPVHLELADLGRGAGEAAIERVTQLERNREPYAGRFLFLDTDQLEGEPDRAERSRRRASEERFTVIWQEPTHEALLLRHFPGRDTRRPPTKKAADAALAREWADYRKPCSAQALERVITLDGARRVAARCPELASLLDIIGLRHDQQ